MINQEDFINYSPELYNIGKQIADTYRNEIKSVDAVGSGQLLHFQWDVKMDDNGLKLVFFLPDYWRQIEFGRPPTKNKGDGSIRKNIEEWIKDKGIVGAMRYDKKGKAYTPTPRQLSFLITRKIHQMGYDARKPLETAMNNSINLQKQFVDTATKMYSDQISDMIVQLNQTK